MATDRLSFHAKGLDEQIDEFREREGLDSQAEAARMLLRVGLRETQNPLTYRLKDEVTNWAGLLGVTAIVTIIAGLTTPVMHPGHALLVAVILCVTALSLVAVVELVRAWQGQSTVGRLLREVRA